MAKHAPFVLHPSLGDLSSTVADLLSLKVALASIAVCVPSPRFRRRYAADAYARAQKRPFAHPIISGWTCNNSSIGVARLFFRFGRHDGETDTLKTRCRISGGWALLRKLEQHVQTTLSYTWQTAWESMTGNDGFNNWPYVIPSTMCGSG